MWVSAVFGLFRACQMCACVCVRGWVHSAFLSAARCLHCVVVVRVLLVVCACVLLCGLSVCVVCVWVLCVSCLRGVCVCCVCVWLCGVFVCGVCVVCACVCVRSVSHVGCCAR